MWASLAVAVVACLLAPNASSTSWSGVYCGNRLVVVGDPLEKVLELCGEATSSLTYVAQLRPPPMANKCKDARDKRECMINHKRHAALRGLITELTYDLGPQRFIRTLTFQEGTLISVETGWYGTAK